MERKGHARRNRWPFAVFCWPMNLQVIACAALAGLVAVAPVHGRDQDAAAPLGEFTHRADVGAPRIAGSATYDAQSREYLLTAGGANMWGPRDEFHFVWKRVRGDFTIGARVQLLGTGVDPHRKAGLMIRSAADADAAYVDAVVHGDGLTSLQFRRARSGATEERQSAVKSASVLELTRRGTTYVMRAGRPGEPLAATEITGVDLGDDDVLVGLALCSHNADVAERALFAEVRLLPSRPSDRGR